MLIRLFEKLSWNMEEKNKKDMIDVTRHGDRRG